MFFSVLEDPTPDSASQGEIQNLTMDSWVCQPNYSLYFQSIGKVEDCNCYFVQKLCSFYILSWWTCGHKSWV